MVKDSNARKEKINDSNKESNEQRRKKGRSNARGGRN